MTRIDRINSHQEFSQFVKKWAPIPIPHPQKNTASFPISLNHFNQLNLRAIQKMQ
jgi:hypothetical protein